MGGGLALMLAAQKPDQVGAVVPYYGVIAWPSAQPDYSRLACPVLGHYAELDEWAPPATVGQLDATLKGLDKSCAFFVYPGTDHAFANDDRLEVYNAEAAELAWSRSVDFLRANLV
jgi:carboxymethylenebutenolidase